MRATAVLPSEPLPFALAAMRATAVLPSEPQPFAPAAMRATAVLPLQRIDRGAGGCVPPCAQTRSCVSRRLAASL
eukprot:476771-Prymnesium_polylepis.1